jgi:hypothetical protein
MACSGFHSVHADVSLRSLQLTTDVSKPGKKIKIKNNGRDQGEKKNHFIFLSMPFILFAIFKKKKKKSNFEFQNSKIRKKKKKKKKRRENWH